MCGVSDHDVVMIMYCCSLCVGTYVVGILARSYFFAALVAQPAHRLQKDVARVFAEQLEEYETGTVPEEEAERMRFIWEYIHLGPTHPVVIAVHVRDRQRERKVGGAGLRAFV